MICFLFFFLCSQIYLSLASFSHFDFTGFDFFKTYHNFQLSNHLQVLLVTDKTIRNGLVLSIDVGSSYEPRHIPGLAHLLEHMLFYSSAKYPQEYYFKHYIAKFQGFMNANTWDTETNFFFELNDPNFENFEQAIDIFSRFFIDPTLKEEAIFREINAVNNEYENTIMSDIWRFQEIVRNLAVNDSILNHFQIGDTLHLANKNISILKELNQFFTNFYSAHKMSLLVYTSHPIDAMTKLIKEKFEPIIYNKNWQYPQHFYDKNTKKAFIEDENLGLFAWFKSNEKRKMMSIAFPLQNELFNAEDKLVKPLEFIMRILQKKGKNSLYSILRSMNLIHDLKVSCSQKHVDVRTFTVNFILQNIDEVGTLMVLKHYIGYMKKFLRFGLTEKLYKRISFEKYIEFLYEEKRSVTNELLFLLPILKSYKRCDSEIVKVSQNLFKFDKKHIEGYIEHFSDMKHALIIFSTSSLEVKETYESIFRFSNHYKMHRMKEKTQRREKNINIIEGNSFFMKKMDHYDTSIRFFFSYQKISFKLLNTLRNIKAKYFPVKPSEFLPKNKYFPKDLNMETECLPLKSDDKGIENNAKKCIENDAKKNIENDLIQHNSPKTLFKHLYNSYKSHSKFNETYNESCLNKEKNHDIFTEPELVLKASKTQIWMKSDRVFKIPKIASIFELSCKSLSIPPIQIHLFLEILSKLIETIYWESLYMMRDVGYEIQLETKETKLHIILYGFSEKFDLVTQSMFGIIKNATFNEQDFKRIQLEIWTNLMKVSADYTIDRLYRYINHFLNPKNFLYEDFVKEIKGFGYKRFTTILKQFQREFQVKGLLLGNIIRNKAEKLGKRLESLVMNQVEDKTLYKEIKPVKQQEFYLLKTGMKSLILKEISLNTDTNDAVINAYYITNYTDVDIEIMEILYSQFESEAFKYLRTEKQLGYYVGLRSTKNQGILCFYFIVKGSKHNPAEMNDYIETFIIRFKEFIEHHANLFKRLEKISVIHKEGHQKLMFIDANMKLSAAKYFPLLTTVKKVSKMIKKQKKNIDIKEILEFYDRMFFSVKRKLSLQLYSCKNIKEFEETEKNIYINENSEEITIFSTKQLHLYLT